MKTRKEVVEFEPFEAYTRPIYNNRSTGHNLNNEKGIQKNKNS